jgi:hypothetical protein
MADMYYPTLSAGERLVFWHAAYALCNVITRTCALLFTEELTIHFRASSWVVGQQKADVKHFTYHVDRAAVTAPGNVSIHIAGFVERKMWRMPISFVATKGESKPASLAIRFSDGTARVFGDTANASAADATRITSVIPVLASEGRSIPLGFKIEEPVFGRRTAGYLVNLENDTHIARMLARPVIAFDAMVERSQQLDVNLRQCDLYAMLPMLMKLYSGSYPAEYESELDHSLSILAYNALVRFVRTGVFTTNKNDPQYLLMNIIERWANARVEAEAFRPSYPYRHFWNQALTILFTRNDWKTLAPIFIKSLVGNDYNQGRELLRHEGAWITFRAQARVQCRECGQSRSVQGAIMTPSYRCTTCDSH